MDDKSRMVQILTTLIEHGWNAVGQAKISDPHQHTSSCCVAEVTKAIDGRITTMHVYIYDDCSVWLQEPNIAIVASGDLEEVMPEIEAYAQKAGDFTELETVAASGQPVMIQPYDLALAALNIAKAEGKTHSDGILADPGPTDGDYAKACFFANGVTVTISAGVGEDTLVVVATDNRSGQALRDLFIPRFLDPGLWNSDESARYRICAAAVYALARTVYVNTVG